ncbi:pyridoxal kinase PdxY [Vibrio aestuarianus]|uniref:pyridoxal kinase PdxY n=1 Tax=Vibrio aestuarianus TaxID=28171 RepID=UPI0015593287|nr:pyridoxal kinase PdxY [Vibrio aestuarianus]NGZ14664.1 pyridoxal kinase PdxY [Vibrio aestuarianus]NKZ50812.1 pyridoxal kinase PdxY [Vibrio aestuarianus]
MKSIISIQSHVVFGHTGNSSAVFPMQRMGVEVWPIHTVQYSNHTHYKEGWTGQHFSANDISTLIQGLHNIHQLGNCSALISGYLDNSAQCDAVTNAVIELKKENSQALYVYEPSMCEALNDCSNTHEVKEKLMTQLIPMSDVLVLSQTELAYLTEMPVETRKEAVIACRKIVDIGPNLILVKQFDALEKNTYSMMLVTPKASYISQRPYIEFEKPLVGFGDLVTGIFTAALVKGMSATRAFDHAHNAVYGVLKITEEAGSWELETILAQDEFVEPSNDFSAVKVV